MKMLRLYQARIIVAGDVSKESGTVINMPSGELYKNIAAKDWATAVALVGKVERPSRLASMTDCGEIIIEPEGAEA